LGKTLTISFLLFNKSYNFFSIGELFEKFCYGSLAHHSLRNEFAAAVAVITSSFSRHELQISLTVPDIDSISSPAISRMEELKNPAIRS
jgi:hypothetical protein